MNGEMFWPPRRTCVRRGNILLKASHIGFVFIPAYNALSRHPLDSWFEVISSSCEHEAGSESSKEAMVSRGMNVSMLGS
jgi:hypothetical protein